MTSPARSVIVDTDPGQDDALAILLALASPELDVLGFIGVAGNVPLDLTTRNIRVVCELAGRTDVPVYAGANRPLKRALVTAEHVHGSTGLDGAVLPEPSMELQSQHGVDFLIETVLNRPENSVTLCMLGPLTNLALALQKEPRIAPRIQEIVMMGGGFFAGGNITPAAEFNIFVDPDAAKIVFESGIPITMFPLDCTHQALTSQARIAAFRALGSRVGDACAGWLEFFERFDEDKYGTDGGPLHDPNVIAYLLQPDIYSSRFINVEVETESQLTLGMTVADWWRVSGNEPNVTYVRDVDANAFYKLLLERIALL
ncbi:nucleoside hydrolase [Pararhizobium sp. IMCC21322]|uniref:nucleoside hydrolase n=1 Tax=Pararhizobium sp. IMCC21322 TaxID=3067903 RepID=UPI0027425DAB|nr:nucleoside hydrolase [Pararhizobium sp. IMCC21322]